MLPLLPPVTGLLNLNSPSILRLVYLRSVNLPGPLVPFFYLFIYFFFMQPCMQEHNKYVK